MTSISMDRAWLTLASDVTRSVQVLYTANRQHEDEQDGDVRLYAGGRRRAITRAGVGKTLSLPIGPAVSDLATLRSWTGQTVLFRNGLGERFWAVYLGVSWGPSDDARYRQATLQLREVTVTEAV